MPVSNIWHVYNCFVFVFIIVNIQEKEKKKITVVLGIHILYIMHKQNPAEYRY